MADAYTGLLAIGDPHLEGRPPGFRKDDYPTVILDKLAWCLKYAINNRLLPVILGDLFDKPRDNPNWMLGRLIDLFHVEVIGLYGNHDVHYHPGVDRRRFLQPVGQGGPDSAGRRRVAVAGTIGGRTGSDWRLIVSSANPERPSPARSSAVDGPPLAMWITHHDVNIPGYDEGWIKPHEIDGIDLVINGHIHRRLADVQAGKTLWVTPGNISRRARSEASRAHVPAALRIDVAPGGFEHVSTSTSRPGPMKKSFTRPSWRKRATAGPSAFVAGLAELQARRTAAGAGLMEFLEQNLNHFEPPVAIEIMNLAKEVTGNVQGEK